MLVSRNPVNISDTGIIISIICHPRSVLRHFFLLYSILADMGPAVNLQLKARQTVVCHHCQSGKKKVCDWYYLSPLSSALASSLYSVGKLGKGGLYPQLKLVGAVKLFGSSMLQWRRGQRWRALLKGKGEKGYKMEDLIDSTREPLGFCALCGCALYGGDYKVSDDDKCYCLACLDVEGEDALLEYPF